ncbi:hypothetical protein O3M35_007654 [Rhynocoris fuscipes]|uniref:Uncharacterized protein n=1 Tax=Rhynocoris fuscipes TaxID=488301 RepID=A0AAW1DFF1_9HEMI
MQLFCIPYHLAMLRLFQNFILIDPQCYITAQSLRILCPPYLKTSFYSEIKNFWHSLLMYLNLVFN